VALQTKCGQGGGTCMHACQSHVQKYTRVPYK
jgi:hypothetical protein